MTELMALPRTDYVNAGVDGTGAAAINGDGVGTIELSGVAGTVTQALLYREGIDIDEPDDDFIGGDADYDEAEIEFDGVPINGAQSYARGANNGWPFTPLNEPPPTPSAGLYRADVTALVQAGGNRSYALAGLADDCGHSANGASLIVYFDDGDPANDFHVAHYEGMQSNYDDYWQFPFTVDYAGGVVEAIFHVADGQASLGDGVLELRVTPGVRSDLHPAQPATASDHDRRHADRLRRRVPDHGAHLQRPDPGARCHLHDRCRVRAYRPQPGAAVRTGDQVDAAGHWHDSDFLCAAGVFRHRGGRVPAPGDRTGHLVTSGGWPEETSANRAISLQATPAICR